MTSGEDRTSQPTAPRNAGPHVVRVSGEMDFDHAEQLGAMLAEAVDEAPDGSDIVVDLRNSSFCDSAGLNRLLGSRQRAQQAGHRLVLAAPSHQMVRMLELTETAALFPLIPAVAL
ncbi:STAS domain-containing protein [Streptomyces sp. NRRL S-87]|uniref:STAS domain-containing protein n=1 Tax=Streptomyces sp. NRRL S-87 TaxID=1463920 RepID=UPI0006892FBC|nr:STAS domain-containing protein [Streptomyces sp. NRRL S-87]